MVTIIVSCPHCGSEEVTRNGRAPNGKQKFRCRVCKRQSRENPTPHASPEERRAEILRAYEERSSLRGLERTFGTMGWASPPFLEPGWLNSSILSASALPC